ncbi:hypothetical protein CH362_14635 [Leptospira saintgironsiae]|uniref:Uncharacterized protein n=1 Tax=Leptospira saintgironsiae TaxID=2023183 RepID=A0A2M9YAG1_9LEPT|nr:hypothetical protein CH362_14635 [Leptospira saintgironsiae]
MDLGLGRRGKSRRILGTIYRIKRSKGERHKAWLTWVKDIPQPKGIFIYRIAAKTRIGKYWCSE